MNNRLSWAPALLSQPGEFSKGCIEGAVNWPLSTLRDKVSELPKGVKLYVYCQVSGRHLPSAQLWLSGTPIGVVRGTIQVQSPYPTTLPLEVVLLHTPSLRT